MTFPGYYIPQDPNMVDILRYVQNVVEKTLRNNPLKNAAITSGLMKWYGNYDNSTPGTGKVNFLWIGEFNPADTNLPGNPGQRGFSLVRDDSRGGVTAINLYDPFPAGGGGLKQRLSIGSGDGQRLLEEARDGGQRWPEQNIAMGPWGSSTLDWAGTTDATFGTIWEGRVSIVGNRVAYRFGCATTNGASGEYRMRLEGTPGGDMIGPTHTLGVTSSAVFDDSVNVTAARGGTYTIRWEGRRTNGVGEVRATYVTARCYTP